MSDSPFGLEPPALLTAVASINQEARQLLYPIPRYSRGRFKWPTGRHRQTQSGRSGDIELGTLESVNNEVPEYVKKRSLRRLSSFSERRGYQSHSIVSAHLNDVRMGIDWPALFHYEEAR